MAVRTADYWVAQKVALKADSMAYSMAAVASMVESWAEN